MTVKKNVKKERKKEKELYSRCNIPVDLVAHTVIETAREQEKVEATYSTKSCRNGVLIVFIEES